MVRHGPVLAPLIELILPHGIPRPTGWLEVRVAATEAVLRRRRRVDAGVAKTQLCTKTPTHTAIHGHTRTHTHTHNIIITIVAVLTTSLVAVAVWAQLWGHPRARATSAPLGPASCNSADGQGRRQQGPGRQGQGRQGQEGDQLGTRGQTSHIWGSCGTPRPSPSPWFEFEPDRLEPESSSNQGG